MATDPRAHLYIADVGSVLAGLRNGPQGPWDAIVLDVDNGPDFLIHPANAALYRPASLRAAYAQLAPGGTLAIWCQGPAPELLADLRQVSDQAREDRFRVLRENRSFSYLIYSVTRPETAAYPG